jgi:hypothetical protein
MTIATSSKGHMVPVAIGLNYELLERSILDAMKKQFDQLK